MKDKERSKALIQNYLVSSPYGELPNHLTIDSLQYKGFVNQTIDSKWISLKINELLVADYYSCQN